MFDIKLKFNEIEIVSIEKEDLLNIYKWLKNESEYMNEYDMNLVDELQFYERFLEYYVSECEFFLKINQCNQLIGIIKGRIEFKNPNEVWITYFILDSNVRNAGLGSEILQAIVKYFNKDFGIVNFYAKIEEFSQSIDFWKKNNFSILKIYKNLGTDIKAILKRNK
ncbi:MAG: GNAT family N-acetyltransferase [Clostridium sp.]|nr:GNAT family N-acetyltransferase [Clostridium sp.]